MPKLIVDNVPADVYQCLQQRAAAKQHSVADEVVQVLRRAVAEDLARKQAPAEFSRRAGYVFLAGMVVVVVVLGLWLLRDRTRDDLAPLAPGKPVEFDSGFHNEEFHLESGSRWRWMGEEGIVQLQNTRQPMVLRIVGRVPVDFRKAPPTIIVQLNDEILEQFLGPTVNEAKEYQIGAAQQGAAEHSVLRIRTNMTVVPKDVDKKSSDGRKLGFKLYELTWTPQDEKAK